MSRKGLISEERRHTPYAKRYERRVLIASVTKSLRMGHMWRWLDVGEEQKELYDERHQKYCPGHARKRRVHSVMHTRTMNKAPN